MWKQDFQSQGEQLDHRYYLNECEEQPSLRENDFLKMINLQERYNYFKTLIKLQRLHNYKQEQNQQNMMKVMLQLIQYYAQCISEAQLNIDNIVAYFQQKMRDLNYHYKAISENNHKKQTVDFTPTNQIQLGEIPIVTLQNQEQKLSSMKSQHNNSLMIAIKNQNIQEHLNHSIKKVEFFKKSIASSIKNQQDALKLRIKDKRKKNKQFTEKQDITQSIATATSNKMRLQNTFKRKKQIFSSFHQIIRCDLSSDSELDEAESLYISNFNIAEESK